MTPFDPAGRHEKRRPVRGRRRSGTNNPAGAAGRKLGAHPFFLYVEGPRDGDILRVWARRFSPSLARSLSRSVVILGGRRPARAIEHFRRVGGHAVGRRGLVVLDRDHHDPSESWLAEPGLELFTWGRRHIESYLLVREAIRRVVSRVEDAEWVGPLIERHVPHAEDEEACRDLDAKRLLGSKGALARELGRATPPAAIARSMRVEEFHDDVLALYERIRAGIELAETTVEAARRSPPDRI